MIQGKCVDLGLRDDDETAAANNSMAHTPTGSVTVPILQRRKLGHRGLTQLRSGRARSPTQTAGLGSPCS